jgi:VCBS repeat-containing protein
LVFSGSNDGISYSAIHTADLTPPSNRFTNYADVTFTNTTAYRYYKLEFPLAENGNGNIQLSEIRLIGSSGLIQNVVVGEVTEIADGAPGENLNTLSASGSIAISDVDLLDVQSVTYIPAETNYLGTFTTSVSNNTTSDGTGQIVWNFFVPDASVDYLSAGQTKVQTYAVTVNDGKGGTLTQNITVTITGTNDTPTITTVAGITDVTGAVTEDTNSTTLSDTGTITFDDVDLTNAHTVSVVKASGILGGILTLGSVSESATTTAGSVPWTYSVANSATQYLAAGQTASEVFTVTISDINGGTVTQNVTVTATGTNDAPVVGTSQQSVPDINLMDSSELSLSLPVSITSTNFNYTQDPYASRLFINNNLVNYSHQRGHTLHIINSTTGAVENSVTFDTYGQGTSGLVSAINAVPAGKTIALVSWDATSCDVALNSALSAFGSTNTATWGPSRISHAFVGSRGLVPGSAFEQNSSSNLTMSATMEVGASLTSNFNIEFTDIDVADVYSVTVTNVFVNGVTSGVTRALSTADITTLKSWVNGDVLKETDSSLGNANITFKAPANSFDYLAANEVLTLT